jgi:peptide subunit release factor 1 (eRF1)
LVVAPKANMAGSAEGGSGNVSLADTLVTRAKQTAARVTFIEDASLLESIGGVGAILRYRI